MAESVFLKEMGQRIMLRRKAMMLTQDALADRLGVSTQMISNLELGKKAIRPENLAKLCEVLELSADFILTGCHTHTAVDELSNKLVKLTPEQLRTVSDLLEHLTSLKK